MLSNCEHKNGWIIDHETDNDIVIYLDDSSTFQATFICNNLDCSTKKVFNLDIDAWEAKQ